MRWGRGGQLSTMACASWSSPTTWWISGISPSAPSRASSAWIPPLPASSAKATSLTGPARSEPSPISRSSASGVLPTPTRWQSLSGGAIWTSSEPPARRSRTPFSRRRSRRGGMKRSGNASAATSATPAPSTAAISAARRTPQRVKNTAGQGLRARACWSSVPGRPAWSARSSSQNEAMIACT